MNDQASWLGVGLYTAAEASRLLDLPAARVRRRLGGYRSAGHTYEPLWTPQLPRLDDRLGLGFLDLMQLRVVARIVAETEISLQALRKPLLLARELIHHDHPFATTRSGPTGAGCSSRSVAKPRNPSSLTCWASSTDSIGSSSQASET